jgi:uncharacterized membrane protein YedE/YeeE
VIETYTQAALGGALIGLALATLAVVIGRRMSASGMIASLLDGREGLAAPSIAFIAGLFIATPIMMGLGHVAPPPVEPGWPLLVAGGLLVGIGARLGDGSLLSAVIGLARMSGRALVTVLAIVAGAVVSFVIRQFVSNGGVA